MNLNLVSFADTGKIASERVVFKVTENDDVGDYTVLCSQSDEPGTASSGSNPAFWFPNEEVKKGDVVVLYTKSGKESKKDIGDGKTAYFFYWGLTKTLWNRSTKVLVLIEAAQWTMSWPAETVEPDEPTESSSDGAGSSPSIHQ
jgi:hypothetical protein